MVTGIPEGKRCWNYPRRIHISCLYSYHDHNPESATMIVDVLLKEIMFRNVLPKILVAAIVFALPVSCSRDGWIMFGNILRRVICFGLRQARRWNRKVLYEGDSETDEGIRIDGTRKPL